MQGKFGKFLDQFAQRRMLKRWRQAIKTMDSLDPNALRALHGEAGQIRREIDRLTHAADGKLALIAMDADRPRRPIGSDWAWRPALWRCPQDPPGLTEIVNQTQLGQEATIFHDCDKSELSLRQLRNHAAEDRAPFAARLDVFRFDGSFLSLVLDFPPEACQGLGRRHVIRMDAIVDLERRIEIFARLNVKHGPNTDQVVRELPLQTPAVMVEFDLGYSDINEKRVEKIWVDLIFETPRMNQITLRDVAFSRRPRAEI
ncbi:hypothetical protein U879_16690 [Defluviimonas sp. 20V17]|uniref:Uncharacterized protein n=1 Tax=Allgaiera indica TaxID=765699 RepID=A0AAN5A062_9RHOB|nr:DUF6478 family protein [Allgaiera indica]KDB02536.1 hypothetical protein U879_16690 [Defluviimonas sp. 20V17]GHE01603.1 hypothetical protein GCM10008024_17550 [Allgaiera indica]SDW98173.1 hypothetical protein SAMN05444006_108196 [Allgaiera indica]